VGFFSKIRKSFKRITRKFLPVIAKVAPFIPALAPFAPLIQLGSRGISGGGPTGRAVAPPVSTVPRRVIGPPARLPTPPGIFGPITQAGRISVAENRGIDAAILLGQAALRRGPIAGPSLIQLPRQGVPSPIFAGGINVAGLGAIFRGIGGLVGGRAAVGAGALATGGAAGNLILSSTGRILSVVTATGARISRKRMVAIAKSIGLQAGAAALGIGLVELATVVTDDLGRPRRRRGITARDFTTTRRTMNKIKSMHAMLPTRATARRAGPAHVRTAAITHGS